MKNIITNLSQPQAITILRILYPLWAIIGMFGIMYVPSVIIVAGDAAQTASNLIAHELLFRAGIVGSLLTQLIGVIVVLVLYQLFKRVNKNHAMLMVIFLLVGVPIAMLNTLNRLGALLLVKNPDLMMLFLNLNIEGVQIASIFWGLWLLPMGYLIYKSGYFPKILGVFMFLAGISYFLASFIHFLFPSYEAVLSALEILINGEVLFMLWVIFMGAKLEEEKTLT